MDNYLFKAYVVNAFEYDNGNKETSGTWIYFPASDSEIGDALKQIGLSDHAKTEKYFIDGYVCHLKAIEPLLNIDADVYELDKTARLLATLSDFELQKLGAVMETGARFETLTQVREFARNVDYFQFEPGIVNTAELGRYCIYQSGSFDGIPEYYKDAIDPAIFGKRIAQAENGVFTPQGYIYCSGDEWNAAELPDFMPKPIKEQDRKPSIKQQLTNKTTNHAAPKRTVRTKNNDLEV